MPETTQENNSFALIIPLLEIKSGKKQDQLILDEASRDELAKQLDLISLESFICNYQIIHLNKKRAELQAHLKVELTQSSAVSLKPLPITIDEKFSSQFWPSAQNNPAESPELELEFADELVEFYEEDKLNIGQVIYEQFIIALDLYPRGEGETFILNNEEKQSRTELHPFAVLKTLKNK